jgi:hypothetical protein
MEMEFTPFQAESIILCVMETNFQFSNFKFFYYYSKRLFQEITVTNCEVIISSYLCTCITTTATERQPICS